MRELEGSIGIADAFRPDVGDAVALGIGRVRARLPGEIGAHAVGCAEPRTLADQNNDAVSAKCCGNGIADGDAAMARNVNAGSEQVPSANLGTADEILSL